MPALRAMSDEEASAFAHQQLAPYIEERVAGGEPRAEAVDAAEQQMRELFPDGSPAPGQRVFRVVDDHGSAVGTIWIGPRTPEHPEAYWVWDVAIDEGQRGRGLGRAAMVLAEAEARTAGATQLGLNVSGSNTVARSLYESLGYEPSAVLMRKAL